MITPEQYKEYYDCMVVKWDTLACKDCRCFPACFDYSVIKPKSMYLEQDMHEVDTSN